MSSAQWRSLDATLVGQFRHCWMSSRRDEQAKSVIELKVVFRPNGSLLSEPVAINGFDHPSSEAAASSAIAAVRRCAPFKISDEFKPFYTQWKTRVIQVDPDDLGRVAHRD